MVNPNVYCPEADFYSRMLYFLDGKLGDEISKYYQKPCVLYNLVSHTLTIDN